MTNENRAIPASDNNREMGRPVKIDKPRATPRWFVVLLLLWSVSALWSSVVALAARQPVAGLLFFVCACMLFPPLWRWLPSQGVSLSVKARTAIAAMCLVAGAVATVATKSAAGPEMPTSDTDTASAKARPSPDVKQSVANPGINTANVRSKDQNAKLARLLAAAKNLDERDYEGQLAFWDDILPLAPENREYARKRQEVAEKLATLEHLKEHPELGMVVEKVRPRRGGFGTLMLVDFTLRNDSLSDLKDFHITCVGKGRSGSDVDRNSIILYEFVSARRTRTIRDVNMGLVNPQVASTTCTVDEATIR